jgi:hypothetical protein
MPLAMIPQVCQVWFFSHSAVLFEKLRLHPKYTREQSMVMAAKRLANILEAVPLPLDSSSA